MLCFNDIKFHLSCQGFECTRYGFDEELNQSFLIFQSDMDSDLVSCPCCNGKVYLKDTYQNNLKDIPLFCESEFHLVCIGARYQCKSCGHTFQEENPFRYPGTNITSRAAAWIQSFLKNKISIRSIQKLTGIHWETIHTIQKKYMDEMLDARKDERIQNNYKPHYLAVDEFAIHKGHRYATSVMDLQTGEILWVGKDRTIEGFEQFFKEYDLSSLSEVIAVAMDMNAAYNELFSKYLPQAEIVYDRYHMQSQYGREVLGAVRLDEARKHKLESGELEKNAEAEADSLKKQEWKQKSKEEKQKYSTLKKARWPLLMNSDHLTESKKRSLETILEDHESLAICYAMKEEMIRLFQLTDLKEAEKGWIKWFEAAKSSEIGPLKSFAKRKEKRLPGLIAHAKHPISTGKLEGYNNKIKVAKRIGYGYRDDNYFFTLIRFLSIPKIRSDSPL